jgi:hypothetical protein
MFMHGTPAAFVGMPLTRLPCGTFNPNPPFSDFGCSDSAAGEIVKK